MTSDALDNVLDDAQDEASDHLILLAQAFDLAWAQFSAAEGPHAATEENRRRLARQLVALCRAGESDVDALARAALTHLHAFAAAMRISQRHQTGDALPTEGSFDAPAAGASFSPETVLAMRQALELCLKDLPLRLPAGVREALSAEIMSGAVQGERDPERLCAAALATLARRR